MKQISEQKLAQAIKRKCEEYGYTEDYFGELVNSNPKMIGRVELGNHLPAMPQLNKILGVLDIPYDTVLMDSKEEEVFDAFLNEARTYEEREGFEKMVSMMLTFRKHVRLKGIHSEH